MWGPQVSHHKMLDSLTILCTLLHKLHVGTSDVAPSVRIHPAPGQACSSLHVKKSSGILTCTGLNSLVLTNA